MNQIGQCAFCKKPMRLVPNDKTGYRYYRCRPRSLLGKSVCENRFAYRQDIIEDAMLHQFGLGWLEAEPKPRKAPVDPVKLKVNLDKLLKRQKDLEAAYQTQTRTSLPPRRGCGTYAPRSPTWARDCRRRDKRRPWPPSSRRRLAICPIARGLPPS